MSRSSDFFQSRATATGSLCRQQKVSPFLEYAEKQDSEILSRGVSDFPEVRRNAGQRYHNILLSDGSHRFDSDYAGRQSRQHLYAGQAGFPDYSHLKFSPSLSYAGQMQNYSLFLQKMQYISRGAASVQNLTYFFSLSEMKTARANFRTFEPKNGVTHQLRAVPKSTASTCLV